MNTCRISLTLGAAAGGLLAAAFLPMAVAFADDIAFGPDGGSFVPTEAIGYPPLYNELVGTEAWNLVDFTNSGDSIGSFLQGVDANTTFGSFINDDLLTGPSVTESIIPAGTQIDDFEFGGGFENEWIDIPSGQFQGMDDALITPFGEFSLLGTFFTS